MTKYIEREAALEICEKEYKERLRMLDYCGDTVAWNVGNAIKSIPAAEVAPVRHGEWEGYTLNMYCGMDKHGEPIFRNGMIYYCSQCGRKSIIKENYCPNCGAKMDTKK